MAEPFNNSISAFLSPIVRRFADEQGKNSASATGSGALSGSGAPPTREQSLTTLTASATQINFSGQISSSPQGITAEFHLDVSRVDLQVTYGGILGGALQGYRGKVGSMGAALGGNRGMLFGVIGNSLLSRGANSQAGQLALTGLFMRQTRSLASMGGGNLDKYLIVLQMLMKKDPKAAERFMRQLESLQKNNGDAAAFIDKTAQDLGVAFRQVQSAKVQTVSVDVRIEISGASMLSGGQALQAPPTTQSDPLIFDLDADGFELTGAQRGVLFDINGDGGLEQTSFVTGGDAFLALDSNQNGRIDSGKELFGDQNGAENGFEELRKYDANKDNKISAEDPVFSRLRAWRDITHDGISQDFELRTLSDYGISEISLDYADRYEAIGSDALTQRSGYKSDYFGDGSTADALLSYVDLSY